jgi:hypothetical protein
MTNQDHVFNILDDVLVLLSGQGFPTPERTYKLDGSWGLALSDLRRCFDQYRARIAELEAETTQAKAVEARAVEALTQGRVLAQEVVGETWDLAGSFTDKEQALFDWVEDLDWPRYPTPALDWLAQREREAVVRELEQLMESEWKWEEFELQASIHARLADLRNQQFAACSRNELRGAEKDNA